MSSCPKCGAKQTGGSPVIRGLGITPDWVVEREWECGRIECETHVIESDACKIRELTVRLARLAKAAKPFVEFPCTIPDCKEAYCVMERELLAALKECKRCEP